MGLVRVVDMGLVQVVDMGLIQVVDMGLIQVVDMGLVQLKGGVLSIMKWWLHMYNHFHSTNYFVVEVYMYPSILIST